MNLKRATTVLGQLLNEHHDLTTTLGLPLPDDHGFRAEPEKLKVHGAYSTVHLRIGQRPERPEPRCCNAYLVAEGRVKAKTEALLRLCPPQTQVLSTSPTRAILQQPDGHTIDVVDATQVHRDTVAQSDIHRWTEDALTRLGEVAEVINSAARSR